jgi:O-antigen/teichoic acid export membrane protein
VDAFTVAVLIVPFSLCTRSAMQYLLVLKRSRTHTAIQLAKTVFEAGLKLWMLFGLEWGVYGFLLSVLIGEALFALILLGWMAMRIGLRFDWSVFRPMLIYALPLLPVGVLQLLLHQGDRVLLGHLGPAAVTGQGTDGTPLTTAIEWVGVYGLGYKIGFLLHTAVLASFMQIWQPHVFGLGDRERTAEMRRVGTFALVALALIYLPAAVFGRQAVDLLSGDAAYREAWRVVPWIVLAYLAYAAYSMAQVALFSLKRTWPLLWLNAAAVVLNLGLNAYWIPRFAEHGYLAPTFVTLLTFLFMAAAATVVAQRAGLPSFHTGRALVVALLAGAAAAGAYAIDAWRDPLEAGALWPVLGLKALLAALLIVGLWRLALDADGRDGLRRLGRDLVGRVRP